MNAEPSLWPHQDRGLLDAGAAIMSGERRVCLTSPTGGGKTRMASTQIIRSNDACAFYTHRRMLLTQTGERFETLGIPYGFRASQMPEDLAARVQLIMIQSEAIALKKGRRDYHPAKLVFVDECHHNKAGQACEIMDYHVRNGGAVIGLTATPLGLKGKYDRLIVAGTNSELRACGSHIRAVHYAPDEPAASIVGRVKIGEGVAGIDGKKQGVFAQKVFGSVVEHWKRLNQGGKPSLLFAPGVAESKWFAETLTAAGINAAHIDGSECWFEGQTFDSTPEVREEIAAGSLSGRFPIVCNRFVLREGVDWPWLAHCIFATIFGSLTAYLQAGGRVIRNHPSLENVVIQDHGGNWWRHGSLNEDRVWDLDYTDAIVAGMRLNKLREKKEAEPIVCPKCQALRTHGAACFDCGFRWSKKGRPVLQSDGTLKTQAIPELKARRPQDPSQAAQDAWRGQVIGTQNSKKATVKKRTFNQLLASNAERNNWKWLSRDLPMMPQNEIDWFRPVSEVPKERLR